MNSYQTIVNWYPYAFKEFLKYFETCYCGHDERELPWVLEGSEHPFLKRMLLFVLRKEDVQRRRRTDQSPKSRGLLIWLLQLRKKQPLVFSLSCSSCCRKRDVAAQVDCMHDKCQGCSWMEGYSSWGSPDSVSDVDRVAGEARKCQRSPKIRLQPLHCMESCTQEDEQGMKKLLKLLK